MIQSNYVRPRPVFCVARGAVLCFMGATGTGALAQEPAVCRAVEQLSSKNWEERHLATTTLRKLRGVGQAAVPALQRALMDPHPSVREGAALALGGMGLAGMEAAPDLARCLDPSDASLSEAATEAIVELGPDAARALMELPVAAYERGVAENGADSEEPWDAMRERCTWIVRVVRRLGKGAIPPILDTLESRRWEDRWVAATLLGFLGETARPGVTALSKHLVVDSEDCVRRACLDSLARLGPVARAAAPVLQELKAIEESFSAEDIEKTLRSVSDWR